MKNPTRYTIASRGNSKHLETPLVVSKDGHLVRWEDYEALRMENEKFRRCFNEGERGWTLIEPNHYESLKTEVLRLRRLVPSEDDRNRGGFNP